MTSTAFRQAVGGHFNGRVNTAAGFSRARVFHFTPGIVARGLLWASFFFLSNVSFYFVSIIVLDLLFWKWRRPAMRAAINIAVVVSFAFALSVLISLLRGSLPTDMLLLATSVTIAAIIALLSGANSGNEIILPLRIAFVTFLLTNLLLYLVGIESYELGQRKIPSVTLQMIGIDVNRAFFFFSRGVNAFGTVAGIMTVFLLADFRTSRSRLALLGALLGIIAVLLADTRGALLGLLMIGPLAFLRVKGSIVALVTAALIPAGLFLVQLEWIGDLTFEGFVRIGSDISSGRIFYWAEIIERLNKDSLYWIFGAGIDGTNQIGMRVQQIDNFLKLYSGMKRLPDAHNMLIDLVVTGGLFKGLIYSYLLITTTYILARSKDTRIRPFCTVPAFLAFSGIFESVLSYGRLEIVVIVFLMIGVSRSLKSD